MNPTADRKVSRGVYVDRAAAVEGGVDTAGTVEQPFSSDIVQSSGYSADLGPHLVLEPPRHRVAEVCGGSKILPTWYRNNHGLDNRSLAL